MKRVTSNIKFFGCLLFLGTIFTLTGCQDNYNNLDNKDEETLQTEKSIQYTSNIYDNGIYCQDANFNQNCEETEKITDNKIQKADTIILISGLNKYTYLKNNINYINTNISNINNRVNLISTLNSIYDTDILNTKKNNIKYKLILENVIPILTSFDIKKVLLKFSKIKNSDINNERLIEYINLLNIDQKLKDYLLSNILNNDNIIEEYSLQLNIINKIITDEIELENIEKYIKEEKEKNNILKTSNVSVILNILGLNGNSQIFKEYNKYLGNDKILSKLNNIKELELYIKSINMQPEYEELLLNELKTYILKINKG